MAGQIVELRRVAGDALPTVAFDIDVVLSTSFDDIQLDVRLETGVKLQIRSMIVDNDANGLFHFEFAQDEIPAGVHTADLIFHDLVVPLETFTIPEDMTMIIIARERV